MAVANAAPFFVTAHSCFRGDTVPMPGLVTRPTRSSFAVSWIAIGPASDSNALPTIRPMSATCGAGVTPTVNVLSAFWPSLSVTVTSTVHVPIRGNVRFLVRLVSRGAVNEIDWLGVADASFHQRTSTCHSVLLFAVPSPAGPLNRPS